MTHLILFLNLHQGYLPSFPLPLISQCSVWQSWNMWGRACSLSLSCSRACAGSLPNHNQAATPAGITPMYYLLWLPIPSTGTYIIQIWSEYNGQFIKCFKELFYHISYMSGYNKNCIGTELNIKLNKILQVPNSWQHYG